MFAAILVPQAASILATSVLLLAVPAPAAVTAAAPPVALRLEAGSVAREQLVAVGRDLVVAGHALSDVAALDGSVDITGQVGGDVIVLGGDARLAASARVTGDVFVLGGAASAAPGAQIGGRLVSYATASAAWLTLLEGPTLGLAATSPVVLGGKLALLAAWAALLLLFFAASGREVLSTADGVRREPFRSFFVGLTGVVTLLLTGLFVSAFAGGLVSLPLVGLLIVLGLVLKLWGMIAVFHALGEWIGRRLLHRRLVPINAATVGLLVLGALKFLPWIGVWTWTAATLIGVGAALSTKFGRREPWFELGTA
jgi:hypothetical protein